MARTPQSTRTCTMRSSEHAAHRPLMHSVHIALLAQGLALCVIHVIHACAPVSGLLSVLFLVSLSFYFLSLFLFQLYLMSTSAPDEMSVPNPLCDSSLGSVVTSDYVTPLTVKGHADEGLVAAGRVRELDRLGNNAADEAADFGRRRVAPAVIDARRNLSGFVVAGILLFLIYIGSLLLFLEPLLITIGLVVPLLIRWFGLLVLCLRGGGLFMLFVILLCFPDLLHLAW